MLIQWATAPAGQCHNYTVVNNSMRPRPIVIKVEHSWRSLLT
jgi:hypothetical protein